MPNWVDGTVATAETAAIHQMNQLLAESVADMQRMYQEDIGWVRLGETADQFTPDGRNRIAALCRLFHISNPLIKRGLGIRVGYVWGQGVTVTVDDDGATGQDVNAVIEAFWEDPSNRDTFTTSQAQEKLEQQLGTHGEVFLALPTVGGRVRVRSLPPEQIEHIITNPEDAATRWYYLRAFDQYDPFTGKTTPMKLAYPNLGYWPANRPATVRVGGDDWTVRWDAPVRAVQVNVPSGWDRGIGDVFAALPWARASKEFLEDWAKLSKALARIAWRVTTKGDKAAAAARAVSQVPGVPGNPQAVGSTVGLDANSTLEAVPKTGAHIDANSGLPLQTMVAAALGVPLTMLTGNPGDTGARSVAETLDQPTEHEMGLRRQLWTGVLDDICGYVIDQAVITKKLTGKIVDDTLDARRTVTLPDEDSRTIKVNWPEWDSTPVNVTMAAILAAVQTELMPPVEMVKLIGQALGIEDIDGLVDQVTDDDGNFIPQAVQDQQALDRATDQGLFGTPSLDDEPQPDDGE